MKHGFGAALLLILLGGFAFPRHPRVVPAQGAETIPDVQVLDESAQPVFLRQWLGKNAGPVVLLPIYTRCQASCPALTRKLEVAARSIPTGTGYRVVVLSFDPLETSASLRLYRRQMEIPVDWKLFRADAAQIRQFFAFFHYSIMQQDGVLNHPNEIFLLDSSLTWRWTLAGDDWSPQDFATALEWTISPGFFARLSANPVRLAWIGFIALAFSFSTAGGWMLWRKPFA